MQILALLDIDALNRLRIAVARTHDVRGVDVAALETHLDMPGSKLVVVNPADLRPDAFIALIGAARAKRNVSVLIYTDLNRDSATAVLAAATIFPVETVFFGAHDERTVLATTCARLLVPSSCALAFRGLTGAIEKMPPPLTTRVVGYLGWQPIPRSTSAMLDGLGVSTDTAHDWIVDSGIAKPHQLRELILLARAYSTWPRRPIRWSESPSVLARHPLAR
jgi:hypothetical protein